MIVPLLISSLAIGITLLYASYRDLKERRVPFRTWYPMLAVAIPIAIWTYAILFLENSTYAFGYLLMAVLFSALFYFFAAYLHLFGGADAWALIFITATIPLFPIEPVLGIPPLGFFPLTVLVNAVILNLITPLAIFFTNLIRGNRAPIQYMFVGFPIDGNKIEDAFGFIIEEFEENDGQITRRFIRFSDAITRMISGERRMYTRDLKNHPEDYQHELALYRKAGSIWISYGVPFIIPIMAGFVTALFMGDIFFAIMHAFAGV
jgi:preflagellin peptidase FlaK